MKLDTLDAFKGLQIRTMENQNHMAFWSALGAAPTPLAWPEVYISLQNGTIDAQENAADTCMTSNFQEVQKYLNFTNHILYLNQIIINNDKFNSLDPLYQDALTQAVEEAIAELRPALTELDKSSKDTLAAGGMEMVEYAPEFYDEILNLRACRPVHQDRRRGRRSGYHPAGRAGRCCRGLIPSCGQARTHEFQTGRAPQRRRSVSSFGWPRGSAPGREIFRRRSHASSQS